jgi:hypothetical protein
VGGHRSYRLGRRWQKFLGQRHIARRKARIAEYRPAWKHENAYNWRQTVYRVGDSIAGWKTFGDVGIDWRLKCVDARGLLIHASVLGSGQLSLRAYRGISVETSRVLPAKKCPYV